MPDQTLADIHAKQLEVRESIRKAQLESHPKLVETSQGLIDSGIAYLESLEQEEIKATERENRVPKPWGPVLWTFLGVLLAALFLDDFKTTIASTAAMVCVGLLILCYRQLVKLTDRFNGFNVFFHRHRRYEELRYDSLLAHVKVVSADLAVISAELDVASANRKHAREGEELSYAALSEHLDTLSAQMEFISAENKVRFHALEMAATEHAETIKNILLREIAAPTHLPD